MIPVAALVAACSAEPASPEVAVAVSPVVRGTTDDSSQARATVRISHRGLTCSGTLIAPDWVLTAAHCIGSYEGARVHVLIEPADGGVAAPDGGVPAQTVVSIATDRCYIHPEAYLRTDTCMFAGATGDTCESTLQRLDCFGRGEDFALLHLAEPVAVPPRSIAPPRMCLSTGDPERDAGTTLDHFRFRFRGYGSLERANPPPFLISGAARPSGDNLRTFADSPGTFTEGDS